MERPGGRRILFIENRQMTGFWLALARGLEARGHEVWFLVQNHAFAPVRPRVVVMPYPSPADCRAHEPSAEARTIAARDRGVLHFGVRPDHYGWYEAQVQAAFDKIRPDIVFGEATLFHELLAIQAARRAGIEYLLPCITRVPAGRIHFTRYDTLETFGGSGDALSADEALAVADGIRHHQRAAAPRPSANRHPWHDRWVRATGAGRVALARWTGERFNTPSVRTKRALERTAAQLRAAWDRIAQDVGGSVDGPTIVYPMQMQPEANIDVWGHPFRDQTRLIRELADSLNGRGRLLVKANPYAKYELSAELIDLLASHPCIVPLPRRRRMMDVLAHADTLVTVTGTVQFEAFFLGIPVAVFEPGMVAGASARAALVHSPAAAVAFARLGADGQLPKTTPQDEIRLIQQIVAQSYPGDINIPEVLPSVAEPENVNRLVNALHDVVRRPSRGSADRQGAGGHAASTHASHDRRATSAR